MTVSWTLLTWMCLCTITRIIEYFCGLSEYEILDEALLYLYVSIAMNSWWFWLYNLQGTYLHHKEIKAAQGIKITGQVIGHNYQSRNIYMYIYLYFNFTIKNCEFWLNFDLDTMVLPKETRAHLRDLSYGHMVIEVCVFFPIHIIWMIFALRSLHYFELMDRIL